ncbi:MAG: nuclear transport factor 2 family protein [Saprospiraceae bacterium]|nr:nuclear transport factor 2 family protein [Saprospiraceae bacterium]
MKIFLIAIAIIASFNLQAQTKNSDESELRHIKEELWPQAYQTQDVSLLNQILSDEFQMIDASGNVFLKKDEVSYVEKSKPEYKSFKFHIERLDVYESSSAVVSGTGMIHGEDAEGEYITTYRSSDVFVKEHDAWKAVSSHVSGLHKTHMGNMERSRNGKD